MKNISYITAGRRKNAVAIVKVLEGSGRVLINEKTLDEYFGGLERLKKIVLKPLDVCGEVKNYDFCVSVRGGGVSGQAGAVCHGLARTILKLNDLSKAMLKKEGLLTRDPRMVERKKTGRPKARKRFQFSKR
ncbi:MAG: 30S ribosomal protein S9 [Endomicrobium sp.]|jgi:small subunit ribosomal protein S9|nr:30S ribosomal protein S9 [Endomicrobium sp.]